MASEQANYLTYARLPGLAGFILLGGVSQETVNINLQTSTKNPTRENQTIRRINDGVEPSATIQIEDSSDDSTALIHWFMEAAIVNTDVIIAYLTLPIDNAATNGIVIEGAYSFTWGRDLNTRTGQIAQQNTCGAWRWADWLAITGNTNDVATDAGAAGIADDLPAIT